MGCDIHELIEVRVPWWPERADSPASWKCAGEAGLGRDYEMFEVLAGVRARLGIKPIQSERGLPDESELSEAARAMFCCEDPGLHSAGYVTLAEIKAFDIEQEIDDEHLVLSRDESGSVTSTCLSTTGKHLGPVGKRKVFALWGRDSWSRLIANLESARMRLGGRTDDDVRLVFAFDN